jgi:hypothetical protein
MRVLEDNKDWTPSYELIKNDTQYGWLGSGTDRIARMMAEAGVIEKQRIGKYAHYRLRTGQLALTI